MSSRIDALDQEIARWETVAAATVNNVHALYEHPAYRTLAGAGTSSPPPELTGRTRREIGPAVAAVGELLHRALELKKTVERAASLRADLPLLFRDERLAEIESLLRGPSILLPPAANAAPDALPLDSRDLLAGAMDPGAAPPAMSPAQLVQHMKGAFESARDAIFAVDRAWTTLPAALESAETELTTLETQAAPLGPHAPAAARAALAEVRREVPTARAALRTDPLGALETLEQRIAPRLHATRAGFESVHRQWREAQGELAAARALAGELTDGHALAVAAIAERRLKVDATAGEPPPPAEEGTLADLLRWLDRLAAKVEHGPDWPPARVGLARWQAQAMEAFNRDRLALEAADAVLRERQSLRGLLEALGAKAAACGLAEDPALATLAREARGLIAARPTPLAQAQERVHAYQTQLRALVA